MTEIERIVDDYSPDSYKGRENLIKAIEQYVYKYTQKALDCQQKDHEQYVIKARIEELERLDLSTDDRHGIYRAERIAELKKGVR